VDAAEVVAHRAAVRDDDRRVVRAQRGDRRERRRLDDRAVAGGQRGGDLPGGHDQREVPRDDASGHADRLVADVVARLRERRAVEVDPVG